MPFVGQAEGKGVYGRYHSVISNYIILISKYCYNQTFNFIICMTNKMKQIAIILLYVSYMGNIECLATNNVIKFVDSIILNLYSR